MQLSAQSTLMLASLTGDARIGLTHSAAKGINDVLAVGESTTITVVVNNSATPYLVKELQVDSVIQTIRWADGTAPTAGTASGTDVYSFTLFKTAASTYTVLGSQASYK